MAKRIAVTGGAGFIGSNLCLYLLRLGNHVTCVDNFSSGSLANIADVLHHPRFRLIEHDITPPFELDVDRIYNLACPASPVQDPLPFGTRAGPIREYIARADREKHATFLGRLATYRYLDMHVVVAEALELARKVLKAPESPEEWPRFTGVAVPFDL